MRSALETHMLASHLSAEDAFLKQCFSPVPVSAIDSLFQILLFSNDGVTLSRAAGTKLRQQIFKCDHNDHLRRAVEYPSWWIYSLTNCRTGTPTKTTHSQKCVQIFAQYEWPAKVPMGVKEEIFEMIRIG